MAIGPSSTSKQTSRSCYSTGRSSRERIFAVVRRNRLPTLEELGVGFVPFGPLGAEYRGGALASINSHYYFVFPNCIDLNEADFRGEIPQLVSASGLVGRFLIRLAPFEFFI